ncbi:hypothetical protein PR048_004901 [Dryococelus australis]|uniref:Uncharacterized protein n=1 Tax=Dryococelus australis TaxID=614101 RepID=A0ABQ9I6Q2_9NEOP|nr:hypothetical protein PR048_004901 [Dryococelus australis]
MSSAALQPTHEHYNHDFFTNYHQQELPVIVEVEVESVCRSQSPGVSRQESVVYFICDHEFKLNEDNTRTKYIFTFRKISIPGQGSDDKLTVRESPMRVIEVNMEQRQNERARKTGDPQENPPTRGIDRHASQVKSATGTRIFTSILTKLRTAVLNTLKQSWGRSQKSRRKRKRQRIAEKGTKKRKRSLARSTSLSSKRQLQLYDFCCGMCPDNTYTVGAKVDERLDCSPPTIANRVQFPAESLRIFASRNHAGRYRWALGFLGDPRFPRPFTPAPLHTHLALHSSTLKTSLLRAAQIASLTYSKQQ